MSNFVKFPLILAVVGVICAGALSIVYEITSDTINGRIEAEAISLMSEIVPEIKSAPSVYSQYETEEKKLSKIGVTNLYQAKDANGDVIGYGYLANVTAYQPDLKFIVVLDDEASLIKGFKVISHKETNSGKYGGPLLNSPEFAAQFTNLEFEDPMQIASAPTRATSALVGRSLMPLVSRNVRRTYIPILLFPSTKA